MKVGLVCPYDWSTPGGVQAHIRDLAEQLQLFGHDLAKALFPLTHDVLEKLVGKGWRIRRELLDHLREIWRCFSR